MSKTHYAIGKYHRNKRGEYVSGSWFKRFWEGTKMWTLRAVILSVAVLLVAQTSRAFFPKLEYVSEQVVIDNLGPKIEQLKWKVIADIKSGESNNAKEQDAIITYDPPVDTSNLRCKKDILSFGNYQYKVCTVISYYKVLYGKKITQKEAILIALDDKLAGQLTYDIVFNSPKGDKAEDHWYNTARSPKYNIKGQLLAIKELQK